MAEIDIFIDAAPVEVLVDAAPIEIEISAAQGPAGPTGPAGTTTWSGITDKPIAFPPSAHTHTTSEVFDGVGTSLQVVLNSKAPLASPSLTGTPIAPTAATTTNTTQLATTAFVQQELASGVAVAKNLEFLAHNGSGATIAKGSIVYINGASSGNPRITLSQANNEVNSARTMGFAKEDIASGANGFVISEGELENVKTRDADGSVIIGPGIQIYLSPTVPGGFTRTKPSAPNHLVYVGVVTRASTGVNLDGRILVGIQNGYELNEIHDVAISSPAAKQVVKRNAGNTLWVNEAIVSADVSDATSAATVNTLVRRDGSGGASFGAIDATTLTSAGLTTTGQVEFNGTDAGDSLTFNMVNYTYGTGAASAHRIALGGVGDSSTGTALFGAADAAAANQILGVVSATAKGTTAGPSATTNVITLTIPSAGFWRIDTLSSFSNASGSSTQMILQFDSNVVVPSAFANFRIGQTFVNATAGALTIISGLTASIGAASNAASTYIQSLAYGMIETTAASTLILRVTNVLGSGTSTVVQSSLSATKL